MIRLAAVLVLLIPAPAHPVTGGAAHYGKNVMENVARVRGMTPGRCDVAITNNHTIGTWVTITRIKTSHSEHCRIVDVCNVAKGHCRALARRNVVAELGWPAARRICQISYPNQEPPSACRVTVR